MGDDVATTSAELRKFLYDTPNNSGSNSVEEDIEMCESSEYKSKFPKSKNSYVD
jgi:hypothetical protein